MFNTLHRGSSSSSFKITLSNVDSEMGKAVDNNHVNRNTMNIPDSKWIQVFINGDEYFSGCHCVVNSRHYRNLDMFLNYLTERLKPSFGAIRNIYTPVNGHPVHRLEDLVSKHKYVVAGNERFKKLELGYIDETGKKLKQRVKKPRNKFKMPKVKSLCQNTLSIYCHQNGNFKAKLNKIMLHPQDLENWEQVFQKIRGSLKCGPIKRVYQLNGKPIHSLEELTDNHVYVVVGKHEIFKPGPYEIISHKNSSFSKEKYHSQCSSWNSSSAVTNRSTSVRSQISAQAQKLHFTLPYDESYQVTPLTTSASNILSITELGNGIDSFDSYQASKHGLEFKEAPKIKINLDNDLSGIFRSKTQNDLTAGAVEVEDSSETLVDLPIDLLDAAEVNDEITPDMERSLQQLSLDGSEEIVAYLPSVQNNMKSAHNAEETQVSSNKYNLNHSQTVDIQNIFV